MCVGVDTLIERPIQHEDCQESENSCRARLVVLTYWLQKHSTRPQVTKEVRPDVREGLGFGGTLVALSRDHQIKPHGGGTETRLCFAGVQVNPSPRRPWIAEDPVSGSHRMTISDSRRGPRTSSPSCLDVPHPLHLFSTRSLR